MPVDEGGLFDYAIHLSGLALAVDHLESVFFFSGSIGALQEASSPLEWNWKVFGYADEWYSADECLIIRLLEHIHTIRVPVCMCYGHQTVIRAPDCERKPWIVHIINLKSKLD